MPSIGVRGCSSARDSNQPGFIKGRKPCVRDTFRLLVNARGTRVREEMKRLGIIGSWSVLFLRFQVLLVLRETKRRQRMIREGRESHSVE